jgi:anhydro-N-acetylmuramic acid kinase
MSGTSLDGVDAALVDVAPEGPSLVATHYVPYPASLRKRLIALHAPDARLDEALALANEVTALYAQAAGTLAQERVAGIGCHGQTVRHSPGDGYSTQLINGALLAELTGLRIVCDFRSRDVAAGGQGAPLVPAFHAACFRGSLDRVVLNVGGIANITCLPASGPVTGFDTGPGNVLLDLWARRQFSRDHDEAGRIASRGTVIEALLGAAMQDPYFARPAPKSTGRDTFNEEWLDGLPLASVAAEDVMATLCELTAVTIAEAVHAACPNARELFVCGGGVHNATLMQRLSVRLQGVRVASTAMLGVDPDWVEAMAFAWLAERCVTGEPGNLPSVTGARGPRILGAIYPA